MPSEAEQCVAQFFHLSRALAKRKPVPGADRIAAAIAERVREEAAERVLDQEAEREAVERGWG